MSSQAIPVTPRISVLERYFELSLYLMLLVSVLTLVSTGKLDLFSLVAAPAALLVKGYRWWRGMKPELSNRVATWLVAGYLLYFPVDLWWVSRMLSGDAQNPRLYSALLAAVHLLLFAMIVRLYSAVTTRDYLFLALLSFSAMLASAILTVGSAFLAFFLVFLTLCISTFIGLEMRRASEGAASAPLDAGAPAARRLHAALGITSVSIAAGALAIGTVIFFILPRFNVGYLSSFNIQPSLISGFSDDVELGEIGQIKLSSAVVMRIKVDGGQPSTRDLHWRGIALTTFDGRRWFTDGHEPSAVSQGPDGWIAFNPALRSRAYTTPLNYTVFLEPMASDAIFVAAEPSRIRAQLTNGGPGDQSVRRNYLVMDKTGSLSNPFHNFSAVRYDAVSDLPQIPADKLRAASTNYSAAFRETYLQLPKLDPRIPALAKQIAAGARTPYDQAHAIEMYLRGHYGYTLDLSDAAATDPLAHFLFEKRAGHCEYFAAAMTVMLRSQGIPARYINGFLPGEYNSLGGDYIVRASDAHSWVEVFFPGYGWVTFDPTPTSMETARGFTANLGMYLDWFQLQWSEWVINYDFLHQYNLAQGMQRASRDWSEQMRKQLLHARRTGITIVNDLTNKATAALAEVPVWLPVLLGVLATALYFWRNPGLREHIALAWRLRSRNGSLTPHTAALFYLRTLRMLERRGWKKSPWQTPLEFAASLPSGDLTEAVTQLTETYQSARFGGHGADLGSVSTLLARLEDALRKSPKRR
jgi:transglutaminase-like putative cysteine protease